MTQAAAARFGCSREDSLSLEKSDEPVLCRECRFDTLPQPLHRVIDGDHVLPDRWLDVPGDIQVVVVLGDVIERHEPCDTFDISEGAVPVVDAFDMPRQ